MRVLGVDLGSARIGLASGETEGQIAGPLKTLRAEGNLKKDACQVFEAAKNENAEAIVVGVPKMGDESMSRQAQICERFAEILRELGAVVYTVDESLSTIEAESGLMGTGQKAARRRKVRDAAAASIILERFFAEYV